VVTRIRGQFEEWKTPRHPSVYFHFYKFKYELNYSDQQKNVKFKNSMIKQRKYTTITSQTTTSAPDPGLNTKVESSGITADIFLRKGSNFSDRTSATTHPPQPAPVSLQARHPSNAMTCSTSLRRPAQEQSKSKSQDSFDKDISSDKTDKSTSGERQTYSQTVESTLKI
jgi:hypothetical protein